MTGAAEHPKKRVLGRVERVDLPDWGLRGVRARVDTGARSCALHVENLRHLSGGRVGFDVHVGETGGFRHVPIEARVHRSSVVRSTSGSAERRVFVRTTLRIGSIEREVQLSLANRGHMRFPMLLGRSALRGAFLVDVSRVYTSGRRGKKRRTAAR